MKRGDCWTREVSLTLARSIGKLNKLTGIQIKGMTTNLK